MFDSEQAVFYKHEENLLSGLRVQGKVALVTGGASGMGKADALLLAREGASVIVSDMDSQNGRAVVKQINDADGSRKAIFIEHNVADEENWKAVIAEIQSSYGRLDILVNNAGVMKPGNILNTSLEEWKWINSVNSESQFLGCKYAIPLMEASGEGGSIINMSSTSMVYGISYVAAYSASKGSVDALTRTVAMHCIEAGNKIRVNSIQPDSVRTPLVAKLATGNDSVSQADVDDLNKLPTQWIEPEDVANTVLFLASSESNCINGIAILIDNGACIRPPAGGASDKN